VISPPSACGTSKGPYSRPVSRSFPVLAISLFHWQFTYSTSAQDEPTCVFRNKLGDGRYIFAGTSTSGTLLLRWTTDLRTAVRLQHPVLQRRRWGLFKRASTRLWNRDFGTAASLQPSAQLPNPSPVINCSPGEHPSDGFQLFGHRATDAYRASMDITPVAWWISPLARGAPGGGVRSSADQIVSAAG
jgi:hypothetical protein